MTTATNTVGAYEDTTMLYGPVVGAARRQRLSVWQRTLLFGLLRIGLGVAIVYVVGRTANRVWTDRAGGQLWDWLRTLADGRDRFVAAGQVLIEFAGACALLLLMLSLIVLLPVKIGALFIPEERRSGYAADLDALDAVARYHAALASVVTAMGGHVHAISLRSEPSPNSTRAGFTAVSWKQDGTEMPAHAREWATLVATVAAIHAYRGDTGPVRLADWSDTELEQLHAVAQRISLRITLRGGGAERRGSVQGVLHAAADTAVSFLAEHHDQVDALATAATSAFLRVLPGPLTEPAVQRCLTDPATALADPVYTSPRDQPGTAYAIALLTVSGLGWAAFAASVTLPVSSALLGGAWIGVVAAWMALGRVDGRKLTDRIAYEVHRSRHLATTPPAAAAATSTH